MWKCLIILYFFAQKIYYIFKLGIILMNWKERKKSKNENLFKKIILIKSVKKSKTDFMSEILFVYYTNAHVLNMSKSSKSVFNIVYQKRTCIDCMHHYRNILTKTVVPQNLKNGTHTLIYFWHLYIINMKFITIKKKQ